MAVKTVKVRKDHECDVCRKPILKGEMAERLKTRIPTGYSDEDGNCQEAIWYIRSYRHAPQCQTPDSEEYYGDFRWA